SDGVWSQQGCKLVGTGAVNSPLPAQQGRSVALSTDGNTAILGGPADNTNAGAAWVFAASPNPGPRTAAHDFNGDCVSDIAWRHSSGEVVLWMMNGATAIGGSSPGSAASDWAIVAQRGFNGDGFGDILLRNGTNGQVAVWLMNGATATGGASFGSATSDWSIVGTGDFDGDGFGDILWYNAKAGPQIVVWLTNGTSVIGGGSRFAGFSPPV